MAGTAGAQGDAKGQNCVLTDLEGAAHAHPASAWEKARAQEWQSHGSESRACCRESVQRKSPGSSVIFIFSFFPL